MISNAETVEQYLASLPADRRESVERVRAVIRRHLPKGYVEGMSYGMISYCVPHSLYPPGYHCKPEQPLPFAGLAAQKGHLSLHLMFVYMNAPEEVWLRTAWAKSGKKLDMGKACIRFRSADDVPLEVIGEAFARVPVAKYIATYEAALGSRTRPTGAAKTSAARRRTGDAKPPAKTAAKAPAKTAAKPPAKTSAKMPAKSAAKPPAKKIAGRTARRAK